MRIVSSCDLVRRAVARLCRYAHPPVRHAPGAIDQSKTMGVGVFTSADHYARPRMTRLPALSPKTAVYDSFVGTAMASPTGNRSPGGSGSLVAYVSLSRPRPSV